LENGGAARLPHNSASTHPFLSLQQPGGRLVLQTKRKPAQHPRCGATGVVLNGVSTKQRMFGGRGDHSSS
jgi:ribosomal protein L34E